MEQESHSLIHAQYFSSTLEPFLNENKIAGATASLVLAQTSLPRFYDIISDTDLMGTNNQSSTSDLFTNSLYFQTTSTKANPLIDNSIPQSGRFANGAGIAVLQSQTRKILENFLTRPDALFSLQTAFGENVSRAGSIIQDWLAGSSAPSLTILSENQLQARGAYSQQTNTIYLGQELFDQHPTSLNAVFLEELGHYFDGRLNTQDSPGDEGEIFAHLVQNQPLSPQQLAVLKQEDDQATRWIEGQQIELEQASLAGTPEIQLASQLGDVLLVPGDNSQSVRLTFQWTERDAAFNNEIGVFVVDAQGRVNGINPSDPNYAQTALSSSTRQVLFSTGNRAGNWRDLSFSGGAYLAFYLIQNSSTEVWLSSNSNNQPVAFFSINGINLDGFDHVNSEDLGKGNWRLRWEDITGGGDRDFNDVVFNVSQPGILIPGNQGQQAPVKVDWVSQDASYRNEMGYYLADDAQGRIGTLLPGDTGYAQAALSPGRSQVVFARDQVWGSQQYNLPASQYVGWYFISNDSTANFLGANPGNVAGSSPLAFFSYNGANPDGLSHLHQRTSQEWGWEDLVGGGDRDFNDLVFRFELGTPIGQTSNQPPTALTLSQNTIAENSAANSPIGTFSSQDPDVGDSQTYSLVTGNGDSDNLAFSIVGNELRINSSPDFETKPTYSIRVRTTDKGGLSFDQVFTVNITNVDEPPVGTGILLQEDTVFQRTYAQTFQIPISSSVLSFTYSDLNFDTSDSNALKDAFEVALVDAQGKSLVHTIHTSRDAFLNLSEAQPLALAAGTTVAGQKVTVNLTGLAPGAATAIFRLINNDRDSQTSVRISDIAILPGTDPAPSPVTPAALAATPAVAIDFNQLSDISGSLTANYRQTSFNDSTKVLYGDLAVKNVGSYLVNAPLIVAIDKISDPTVTVVGADGLTNAGLAYYNISSLVATGALKPDETTLTKTIAFSNPNKVQFTYSLLFLGQLNTAPQFISAPDTEALLGKSYRYAAKATDLNGDNLTYALQLAPEGLQIDQATGEITWTPTDVGNYQVVVQVSDAHGGTDLQQYDLAAIAAPPNRPPVITSLPQTDANVSAAYRYLVAAIDPDSDLLTFSLTQKPQGMQIDAQTGIITWQPTASQLGETAVTLKVDDGRGGSVEQTFKILTQPAIGNHAPVIVSDPNLRATSQQNYSYRVKSIDPDADPVTYTLVKAPNQMTIDAQTGQINWQPGNLPLGNYDVVVRASDGRGGVATQTYTVELANFGTIQGLKFNDLNGNQQFDLAESGLAGVTVYLDLNNNGIFEPGEPNQVTGTDDPNTANLDETGQYQFTGLNPGTYYLREVVPNGYRSTSPTSSSSKVGAVVFDGTFNDADWTQSIVQYIPNPTLPIPPDGITAGQRLTGGNPGQYRFMNHAWGGDNPTAVSHTYEPFTYNPATQGAIISLDYSEDNITNSFNGIVGGGINLRQNGDNFYYQFESLNNQQWQTRTALSIKATDFFAADGQHPGKIPDFSLTGAPIQFGYVRSNTIPNFQSIDHSIDNWRVAIRVADAGLYTVDLAAGQIVKNIDFGNIKTDVVALNNPPTVTSAAPTKATVGELLRYQATATDPERDRLIYDLPVKPVGMAIDPNSGLVVWQPTADQVGVFDVILRATDPVGAVALQSFQLVVASANPPPNITAIPPLQPVFNGINRNPAIDSVAPLNATANRLYRYDIVTSDPDDNPVALFLTQAPQGMSIDPIARQLLWIPTTDQIGSQEVILEAIDGQGGLATQKFTVTVRGANLPPMVTSTPPTVAAISQAYQYQVKAQDPENDLLTYSLINDPPAGMFIDSQTGLIQWIPTVLGEQKVEVLIDDGQGGVNLQTYRVQVFDKLPNQLPTITTKPIVGINPGGNYQYDVDATDPEGTAITYAFLTKPDGVTIDPQTGLIQWQTAANVTGEFPTTVVATDIDGGKAVQSFRVKVALNDLPVILSEPIKTITQGLTYRYDVRAQDANSDSLSYRLVTAPTGMKIDRFGRLDWQLTTAGNYNIEIAVDDGRGGIANQAYVLAVTNDIQAPLVELGSSGTVVKKGENATFQVRATDNVGVASLNLTLDGAPLTLNPGQVFANQINSNTTKFDLPGLYKVLATATDRAGNIGTKSLEIRVVDPADTQAPVVKINTTELDATNPQRIITKLTTLSGSVTDDNLEFYRLEYAPVNAVDLNDITATDPDYVVLAEGTSNIPDSVLAQFDPTLLRNDSYFLRLIAQDFSGNLSTQGIVLNVMGENKPGRFTLAFTDLTIPLAGIPIEIQRRYDSLDAKVSGDFGYGWKLGAQDAQIQEASPTGVNLGADENQTFTVGSRVTLTTPDGRRVGFTFTPTTTPVPFFGSISRPSFTADPGVFDKLETDDTPLTIRSDGSTGLYLFGLAYNPTEYRLTTKTGLVYRYSQQQGLLDVTDRNGVKVTYTDAGISSSTGQSITFKRDAQGRIAEIVDPAGKVIKYGYTASGDLVNVIDRASNQTQLTYGAPQPHYLTKVTDPLGRQGTRTEYDAQGKLVKLIDGDGLALNLGYGNLNSSQTITDPLGNTLNLVYDDRGNLVQQVDALGGITARTFDKSNNLLSTTDPAGNTTIYTYDLRGNRLSDTDPLGNTKRYTYNDLNKILTETDALGNTTTNSYDQKGNLLSRRDGSGKIKSYQRNSLGIITEIVDQNNQKTTFGYDSFGYLTNLADPNNGQYFFTYDGNGNVLTVTNPLNNTIKLTYDTENRLRTTTDPENHTTETIYNGFGEKVADIDGLGRRTEYRYNNRGLLIETIYADATPNDLTDNPRTQNDYDAADRLIFTVDEAGRKTNYVYDKLSRLVETIYADATPNDLADNPIAKREYDQAGRVVAEIDERGNRTVLVYDQAGRLITRRNALQQETHYSYDAAGRQTANTDALGHETDYIYDALGRLVTTRFADGTTQQRDYSPLSYLTATTDQAGVKTKYEYDALGRLTAVEDALGQRTLYKRDATDRLTEQTDANNHTTKYEYNKIGRIQSTILPLGQQSKVTYDAVGNVLTTTDFNGETITYTYDERNLLTGKRFANNTEERYTYTLTGQLATVTDGRGVTTYNYDLRNRLLSRTEPDGRQIQYTYDLAGDITSLIAPSGTTTYTYDALNRLETVIDPNAGVTRYTFDAVGNSIGTAFSNGVTETREYDRLNRLTFLKNANAGGILSSYRYTLDPVGNRIKVEENTGRAVNYNYDQLYRLTQESIVDPIAGNRSTTYAFDAVGNRLSQTDSINGTTAYTYDGNDRLLQEVLNGKVTGYSYDNNGNLLAKVENGQTQVTYQWNPKGELMAADLAAGANQGRVEFKYDVNGIRVTMKVNGQETRFLVDRNQQAYAQVIEEYRPDGTIQASRVFGRDLISQTRGIDRTFYQVDGLGSTRSLTNAGGAILNSYTYNAYGQLIQETGAILNTYLFTGEQFDDAISSTYLRARYYNPASGRFLSKDSFPGFVSSPITLHSYLYAGNNPVNLVDPSGNIITSVPGGYLVTGRTIVISSRAVAEAQEALVLIEEAKAAGNTSVVLVNTASKLGKLRNFVAGATANQIINLILALLGLK
jgi:RHS repeat-associated protein